MSRDWSSPVGEIIRAATERVADYQRFAAPVSPVGSKFAPPGFTKSAITEAEPVHYGDDGRILGLAGSRTNKHGGAYPYPIAFFSNAAGSTWNRGHRSKRRADNRFLTEALQSLASFVYRTR